MFANVVVVSFSFSVFLFVFSIIYTDVVANNIIEFHSIVIITFILMWGDIDKCAWD